MLYPTALDGFQLDRYGKYVDDYDDGYFHEVRLRLEFNVSDLSKAAQAELQREIERVYPDGEYITCVDENDRDTGDRAICGYADWLTYEDVLDVLRAYELEFTDLTK